MLQCKKSLVLITVKLHRTTETRIPGREIESKSELMRRGKLERLPSARAAQFSCSP